MGCKNSKVPDQNPANHNVDSTLKNDDVLPQQDERKYNGSSISCQTDISIPNSKQTGQLKPVFIGEDSSSPKSEENNIGDVKQRRKSILGLKRAASVTGNEFVDSITPVPNIRQNR